MIVTQFLSIGPFDVPYRIRITSVSFTGMVQVTNRFPASCASCLSRPFLSFQFNNNGPQARSLNVSWSLTDGMVVRLLY